MFCPRFSYCWYCTVQYLQYGAVQNWTVRGGGCGPGLLGSCRGELCCGAAAEVGRLAPRQWRWSDCGGQETPRSRDGEGSGRHWKGTPPRRLISRQSGVLVVGCGCYNQDLVSGTGWGGARSSGTGAPRLRRTPAAGLWWSTRTARCPAPRAAATTCPWGPRSATTPEPQTIVTWWLDISCAGRSGIEDAGSGKQEILSRCQRKPERTVHQNCRDLSWWQKGEIEFVWSEELINC